MHLWRSVVKCKGPVIHRNIFNLVFCRIHFSSNHCLDPVRNTVCKYGEEFKVQSFARQLEALQRVDSHFLALFPSLSCHSQWDLNLGSERAKERLELRNWPDNCGLSGLYVLSTTGVCCDTRIWWRFPSKAIPDLYLLVMLDCILANLLMLLNFSVAFSTPENDADIEGRKKTKGSSTPYAYGSPLSANRRRTVLLEMFWWFRLSCLI